MNRKIVVFSVLGVALVMAFVAASAITVFALVGGDSAQVEVAPVENGLEIAPVKAEASPDIVKPVLEVEHTSYGYSGGCPFSESKALMTQRTPAEERLEDAPLAQLSVK
jgi:hypothetical protein